MLKTIRDEETAITNDETIMPPWRALEIVLDVANRRVSDHYGFKTREECDDFITAESVLKSYITGPQ